MKIMTKLDLFQYIGAAFLLIAYIAMRRGFLSSDSITFVAMNAVGAGILAIVALLTSQWGFFILEGTWSLVSFIDLPKTIKTRRRNGLAESQDSHLRAKMRMPSTPN